MPSDIKPMTEQEVAAIAMKEYWDSRNNSTFIQRDRENGLRWYNQEPYGDEVEGQSQVVASDIRDTVEWILPDLVEIFVGNDAPVEFEPRNDGDVEAAQQETDYVRHIFNQQNNGYLITYTWLKDLLLSKNGYVYCAWEEKQYQEREEYTALSDPEFIMLMEDPDVEVREHSEYQDDTGIMLHDVLAYRKRTKKCCVIENIPPERIFIHRWHNSVDLQDCKAVVWEDIVTESDLLEAGYPYEKVKDIPSYQWFTLPEEQTRWLKEGGYAYNVTEPGGDQSRRPIQVRHCWLRVDANGDGVAELVFLTCCGPDGSVVLEMEEADRCPIIAAAAIINPHKHYGVSVPDMLGDIQKIRTTLMRQMLNNVYLTNNPQKYIDVNNSTPDTISDLLTPRAGGIVRGKGPAAVTPLTTPFVAKESLDIFNYVDALREERTGVSRTTQGLNPDALADSTNLVGGAILSRAQTRIKMIARNFAETGFKALMLAIHEIVRKNVKDSDIVRLRGTFVEINPREWARRERMSVKVGTGHNDKMQKLANLQQVLNFQKDSLMNGAPFVTSENAYNALMDVARTMGLQGSRYFIEPSQNPPPEAQPDAQMEAVKVAEVDATIRAQKEAAQHELDVRKHQDEMAYKYAQLRVEAGLKEKELELRYGKDVKVPAEEALEGEAA